VRYLLLAWSALSVHLEDAAQRLPQYAICVFLTLLIAKLAIGLSLLLYVAYRQRQESELFSVLDNAKEDEHLELRSRRKFIHGLTGIDRYTVYNGRII
jgi:hypothetical protein